MNENISMTISVVLLIAIVLYLGKQFRRVPQTSLSRDNFRPGKGRRPHRYLRRTRRIPRFPIRNRGYYYPYYYYPSYSSYYSNNCDCDLNGNVTFNNCSRGIPVCTNRGCTCL